MTTLELPILPLRGATMLPRAITPVNVGRVTSIAAVEAVVDAEEEGRLIGVVMQRDPAVEEPTVDDLYPIGTAARIMGLVKPPEGDRGVVFLEGVSRFRILDVIQDQPYLRVHVELLEEVIPDEEDAEVAALVRNLRQLFREIVIEAGHLPDELLTSLESIEDASGVADFLGTTLPSLDSETRQELLEILDVRARLKRLVSALVKERANVKLQGEIQAEVRGRLGKQQREMLLREQLDAIRQELGQGGGGDDIDDLREKIEAAQLPPEAARAAQRELERLERIPVVSPEYTIARTYLDRVIGLPWARSTGRRVDIDEAARILDEDHYDLERVKERILEHLAVIELNAEIKGPILCFVGPPGVGKTSLGRSIARAMGREFVRISLGGMRDEAEIRGHRRTYIGARPGQILYSISRAGANDPVFMLDEIDKLGSDFRGDPASALLEVLDPEQNTDFRDNYLEAPFDLSRTLFITTANQLEPIPPPLRDRMEVLELSGYTEEEKLEIARRYLAKKQAEANAVRLGESIEIQEAAYREVIRHYTREAGVRELERRIGALCRKRARQIVGGSNGRLEVSPQVVRELLGAPRYRVETEVAERASTPGVAVALAWTPTGGDILFVEATRMRRDKGDFTITGSVRDVMKESAMAALSWVRANADHCGISIDELRRYDLHIHVPAGATPKDGPSAGLVMVSALVSLFTQRPLRPRLALTGEITLSGHVLAVGGVKEKVLAARRSGITDVVVPADNRADVEENISADLLDGLRIHYAASINKALEVAFGELPMRVELPADAHTAWSLR
jgi:ATP-dependent Lon protease